MSLEYTPHPIISNDKIGEKCQIYGHVLLYGKIWTAIVIRGLDVTFLTGKHLLEKEECHRYPTMWIHDIFKHILYFGFTIFCFNILILCVGNISF